MRPESQSHLRLTHPALDFWIPTGSVSAIANYFERLGQLVREGHIDAELMGGMGEKTQAW